MYATTKRITILSIIVVVICIFCACYKIFATNTISLTRVELERVVDGDTIKVKNDNNDSLKVRLIGVDCPESVNPDASKNTQEGIDACIFTKSVIEEGQTLWLEQDKETKDKYNRTLAYVWFNDTQDRTTQSVEENSLQGSLLASGNAQVKIYYPNNKYEKQFYEIQDS